jgi:hypothetical protein
VAKIDEKKLDEIAELEVEVLKEGLKDDELRKSPAFLTAVRRFLKENKLVTTPETPGVTQIRHQMEDIPDFDEDATEIQ